MNFTITDEMDQKRAGEVADVLLGERLWIPTADDYGESKHSLWVDKATQEIARGERFAILAKYGSVPVGALVWRLGEEPGEIDLRNISIVPDMRGRHLGSFVMQQLSIIAKDHFQQTKEQNPANNLTINVDAKETNLEMIAFLKSMGFVAEDTRDLYGSGKLDVVMQWRLKLPL